jgi:anti-anti-sigma factor
MEITTRKVGKCKVIDCSGKLTHGPDTLALRKAVREAVQDDTVKVVLNLKKVPYMDIGGFGEMICCYVDVINGGGNLVFLNPSEKVNKLFINTKFLCVFEFFDDEQKALEGCE